MPAAAIVTVGTELTTGLRQDTNSTEIARRLHAAGFTVRETRSVPDDIGVLDDALRALIGRYDLVVITGGLGPTHDDVTREAASRALSRRLVRDPDLVELLGRLAIRHAHAGARADMLRQADVLEGADILPAVTGSAPGQAITVGATRLVLLPGPPGEMRPIIDRFLSDYAPALAPVRLRCTAITESDAQQVVQAAIAPYAVDLTLLAAPGDVEVVLFPLGEDADALRAAAEAAREALGRACYSSDGSSLAEVVLALAREQGHHIVSAESCTGGMVASALTDVPGSSTAFSGGVVAYANDAKSGLLDVPASLLAQHGAVSEPTARAMAEGVLRIPGATIAIATTGIAGPDGGSPEKPVGLVWFAVARADGHTSAVMQQFAGDRGTVRHRATLFALDELRRSLEEG